MFYGDYMKWTASSVIKMPGRISKNAIIMVSLLALSAVLCNMIMFVYIEYLSSYKTTLKYIGGQHEIMHKDMAKALSTDDIYTVFTKIDSVASVIPNIDNIVVYGADGTYVADAKVMREKMVSDIRNVAVEKDILSGGKKIGTMVYFISRLTILEQIIMDLSGLISLNLMIVVTGALVGGYISLRITKPVIALSQHLLEINAPKNKTLADIVKNRHRSNFRSKGRKAVCNYDRSALHNFRNITKRVK